jgi:hypothetical protein
VKRHLFNVLAGVSLLLCVAISASLARSFVRHDCIRLGVVSSPSSHSDMYLLHSAWGRLSFICMDYRVTGNVPPTFRVQGDGTRFVLPGLGWDVDPPAPGSQTLGWYLGFHATNVVMQGRLTVSRNGQPLPLGVLDTAHVMAVDLPYWSPILATSVMPASWMIRRRRQRARLRRQHCTRCGYHLRATPERCPECGTVPNKLAQISR